MGTEITVVETFIGHYGGLIGGAVAVIILFVLLPLRDKWLPSVLKQREEEHAQQLMAMRDDLEFRRGIERERAAAAKVTSDAIQELSLAMIQTNERIAQIMVNQATILQQQAATLNALNGAVTEMKERVAHRKGYDEGKHAPKTGPLDNDKSA